MRCSLFSGLMMKQNKQLEQHDYLKRPSHTVARRRGTRESANSSTLQLQHAVIDIKCKYIRGSLCVRLMTSSNRIKVSLLCRGNVRVEGER